MRSIICISIVALAVLAVGPATAQDDGLEELSLEELLGVEVFSASKRATSAYETPAAITVLSREDLRRRGATTLVEALEWVPGVQFSRLNAANTAVGLRGFSGVLSDKLLVLIDGRSIYSLFYSGVFWDEHDLPIEDVERIEIIRGPGGTLWGANAVNGVINIVTRDSGDTQGWHASSDLGADDTTFRARVGGALGDDTNGRVWLTAHDRDAYATAAEHYDGGGWANFSAGTRIDAADVAGGDLLFTFNGSAVESERQDLLFDAVTKTDQISPPTPHESLSLAGLLRWERPVGSSSLTVQTWFEHHDRDERVFAEVRNSYDLDAQWTRPGERHSIVTGANLRVSTDEIVGSSTYTFSPRERTLTWTSVFFQDEVRLTDRLRVTAGIKLEHNDYSGLEQQPNFRAGLDTGRFGYWWGAVSQAVRTPSRAYTSTTAVRQLDFDGPGGLPFVAEFVGEPTMTSERLLAFELGWRKLLTESVSLDLAAFVNEYGDLTYQVVGAPELRDGTTANPYFAIPAGIDNGADITVRGIESVVDLRPSDMLSLQLSYTFLDLEMHSAPVDPAQDLGAGFFNNNVEDTPRHSGYARLRANPHAQWDLDLGLRLTSALEDVPTVQPITRPPVDGTRELSARIAYRPFMGTEVALIGRNLLDDGRVDFYDRTDIYPSGEIPTQVFLQVRFDR